MSTENYFGALSASQRKLAEHGLTAFPTDEELLDYMLGVDDRLAALYRSLRVEAYRDYRGLWRVGRPGVNPVRYE